jgi:hypothetical protein
LYGIKVLGVSGRVLYRPACRRDSPHGHFCTKIARDLTEPIGMPIAITVSIVTSVKFATVGRLGEDG